MSDQDYSFFGFSCTWCKYKCARKNDMQKHMLTLKHKKNVERVEKLGIMKINHTTRSSMFTDNSPDNGKNNVAPMKSGVYNNIVPPNSVGPLPEPIVAEQAKVSRAVPVVFTSGKIVNECACGKVYKHLSSLCKHRKKCAEYIKTHPDGMDMVPVNVCENSPDNNMNSTEKSRYNVIVDQSDVASDVSDILDASDSLVSFVPSGDNVSDMNTMLAAIITEQSKRNDELKSILEQQSKEIVKLSEKTGTNNVTNITTNNTVNNKFKLNLFLNTECKDAMNIMDFIDSLPVNTADLENVGNFGFVEGMTRILLNGLRDLDIEKRPIHCSDLKRESIYIKDNDTWEKDTIKNDKMKKVIRYVRHKNVKQIPEWQRNNPNYSNYTTKTHAKYMNIISNTLGGSSDMEDDQLQNKIIKKVMPEVVIPKSHKLKITCKSSDDNEGDD